MYKKTAVNGEIAYDVIQFTCDTLDDLKNLPTQGVGMGSTAIVISNAEIYMKNSEGQWIKM